MLNNQTKPQTKSTPMPSQAEIDAINNPNLQPTVSAPVNQQKSDEDKWPIDEVKTVDDDKIWSQDEAAKTYQEMNKAKETIKKIEKKEDAGIGQLADYLPMIKECYQMCTFIINHNNLKKQYELQSNKISDEMAKKDLYTVFEYHGINKWLESDPENLYKHEFYQSDIDIIEKYYDLVWIVYNSNKFNVIKSPKWQQKK